MENQLVQVINESGLDKTKAQILLENFSNYFEIATEWENKAKALVVTSVEQKAEMKMAREGRLFLKEKRVNIEKTRKALKENALREGQAIDTVAKILTNLITPIEKDLEEKERFAEIQEANRRAAIRTTREAEIAPFSEFIPIGLDFSAMSEEDYKKILDGAKLQYDVKIEADRKAEEERVAREQAEAEERERIRLENERLRKESERLKAQIAAEAIAKRREEEKIIQEEAQRAEAERKAQNAPDVEKLKKLAEALISFQLPEVIGESAKATITDVSALLIKVAFFIESRITKMQ